jgi:hypothetical protein
MAGCVSKQVQSLSDSTTRRSNSRPSHPPTHQPCRSSEALMPCSRCNSAAGDRSAPPAAGAAAGSDCRCPCRRGCPAAAAAAPAAAACPTMAGPAALPGWGRREAGLAVSAAAAAAAAAACLCDAGTDAGGGATTAAGVAAGAAAAAGPPATTACRLPASRRAAMWLLTSVSTLEFRAGSRGAYRCSGKLRGAAAGS